MEKKEFEINKLQEQFYFAIINGDPFHDLRRPVNTEGVAEVPGTVADEHENTFDFTNLSFGVGSKNKYE